MHYLILKARKCGLATVQALSDKEVVITVRQANATYSARALGQTASATSGAELAAYRCAIKIFQCDAELIQQPDERRFYTKWLAKPKVKK